MSTYYFYIFVLDDIEHFKTESEDLFILFQNRNLDAIISAVKGSIDSLRKRVTTRYSICYIVCSTYTVCFL